ncbi:MAG: threonylcarbamoyl-AMP synthase [Fimbriimonadaceae bacterium]|nr:threonylcarbamoyl-AMP synthase [Fimbriimonadaceae bacterium]QYK56023.1 MAG: threonylcarbamoyl-AMP synthase [Fimbriimonadaceae bacterium]
MSIVAPTAENIRFAARVVREGGAVVMPTETVYGLACDATNDAAVANVFSIKGRPSENPLIVHIGGLDWLERVAASWPKVVEELALRYWPGPLTLVLPKCKDLPDRTTAGLETVAVRVPDHDVALALIDEAGCPIAAPSANAFSRLSPTTAEAVAPEIAGQVPMILDGGPCSVGLESTVLDLSTKTPQILRPGGVSRADIEAALRMPLGIVPPPAVRRSPGMYQRHYAPRAAIRFVDSLSNGESGLTFQTATGPGQIHMPREPRAYATILYDALRRVDESGATEIAIELPPEGPEWEAVHDRLKKASATP